MASVSGTFTVAQSVSSVFFLRAGETARVTGTLSGTATVALQRSPDQPTAAWVDELTFTATTSGTDYKNTTGRDQYLRMLCRAVSGSYAYTLADIAGDQILLERYDAAGNLCFRVTDEGIVVGGPYVAPVATGVTATDTANLNAAFTAAGVSGRDVRIHAGTYSFTTLTVPAGVGVECENGVTLVHTVAAENGIVLGAGCRWRGGTVESPGTWDGTNTEWLYSVFYTTGDDVTVEGVTLTNVPKVGIGFKNGSRGTVSGCRIYGNYPSGQWTGTETAHFGIAVDPGGGTDDGLFTFTGNLITTCVQGVFVGNYGTGAGRGVAMVGNALRNCWNHGIYAATGAGYTVTGNSFYECQIAAVLTGKRHVFSGNACYTAGTGAENDVPGVSIRDAEGCIVTGNTFEGDAKASSVIISVQEFDATTCVDNIVSHNTVKVAGGSSYAIRVGAGAATTFYGNIIQGNVVRSVGFANAAVIGLVGNSGTQGFGNKILDNTITILGDSSGIYVGQCVDTLVRGNHIRLEYDAPSAKTLSGVLLIGSALRTQVIGNIFVVPAAFGDDVTFRAINENFGSSVSGSAYINNHFSLDPTKLTAAATHVIQASSSAFMDERGTGAPAFAVVAGSRWSRTDGGSSTSLYVKETDHSSTTWAGK